MHLDFKCLSSFVFINILLSIALTSNAQIKGSITDASDHQLIAGASVYINNTSYGTISDAKGQFELQNFPPPPFQLVISSVGYTSQTLDIKSQPATDLKIVLKHKRDALNEVVIIAPEKNGWELFGKDFIKDFIGYSSFAKDCEILNKEVLEFRYNKTNNILQVSAQKPLKIRNNATGYLITYWLDDFEKDYSKHKIFFKGYTQFEALQSKKDKVNAKWQQNRRSAYYGSIQHFMRSVYNNTVYQDSFEIRVLKRVKAKDYGRFVPFRTDTLFSLTDSFITDLTTHFLDLEQNEAPIWTTLMKNWSTDKNASMPVEIHSNRQDSVTGRRLVFKKNPRKHDEIWLQYYDVNYRPVDSQAIKMARARIKINGKDSLPANLPRNPNVLYQVLYKQPMPIDSFATRTQDSGVVMRFKDLLHITYLKEHEEPEYLENQFPKPTHPPGLQESIISIPDGGSIYISADGNYMDPYDLFIEKYWSYEKMDKLLPSDYKPDVPGLTKQ